MNATESTGWPFVVWARRRGLGKTTAYKLLRAGRAPTVIYPTEKRPIVTAEADRQWVDRMTREARARLARNDESVGE